MAHSPCAETEILSHESNDVGVNIRLRGGGGRCVLPKAEYKSAGAFFASQNKKEVVSNGVSGGGTLLKSIIAPKMFGTNLSVRYVSFVF